MSGGFYRDYLDGAEALRPFFAHGVNDLARAAEGLPAWDAPLRDALHNHQTALGLAREIPLHSLAVVTGQQPGLLTGPLYTIYKAITAIQLARRVAAETGRHVVSIFWVASDDHDFEEVRTAHLLTRDHTALALRYAPEADVAALAMHRMPLEASLHGLVDRAADEATGSEFTAEICAFLHESLEHSHSFSDWFARILARLFRDTPLVIFSPDLPAARVAAVPIFARAIDAPLETTRLLNEAGARLAALGYPAQVVKADDECAFFLEVDGRRRKVLHRDGVFVLPEIHAQHSAAELHAMLAETPARFSANVALRPVVQQALFPTLAYIGGPGELAYWAQFRGVFEHFGQPMPIVYPRAQATLTSIKLNKILSKYGLSASDCAAAKDELLQRALAASVKSPALDTFRAGRTKVETAAEELTAALHALKKIDKPSLAAADTAAAQVRAAMDRLEKSLLHADTAQAETVRRQIERVCTVFAPERKPQERFYTVFSYLFEHGWDLIARLERELDSAQFNMHEIEL